MSLIVRIVRETKLGTAANMEYRLSLLLLLVVIGIAIGRNFVFTGHSRAVALGNFQYRGVQIWIIVWREPTVFAVGAS